MTNDESKANEDSKYSELFIPSSKEINVQQISTVSSTVITHQSSYNRHSLKIVLVTCLVILLSLILLLSTILVIVYICCRKKLQSKIPKNKNTSEMNNGSGAKFQYEYVSQMEASALLDSKLSGKGSK